MLTVTIFVISYFFSFIIIYLTFFQFDYSYFIFSIALIPYIRHNCNHAIHIINKQNTFRTTYHMAFICKLW